MKKYNVLSIIEPEEVRLLAFSDVASAPQDIMCGANIEYAISRFVTPVLGEKMLRAIATGEYEELKVKYLQSAVAFYVRYISGYDSEVNAMKIITRARHYLKEMSQYLNAHSESYKEYDGAENILNRCKIYGDLVQIL